MITPTEVSKTWQVNTHFEGQSIRDFLRVTGEFSRQLMKKVRLDGRVYVNGVMGEFWTRLREGDTLKVIFPEEEKGGIEPMPGLFPIVYEDEDVLVLDKPSGLPVVPPLDRLEPSLASYLLYYYQQKKHPCTAHIVTRLDRHTSGLVLVAKHAYSHMLLTKGLKNVERRYQAIVHGTLEKDEGFVDLPIAREEGSIIRRTVSMNGKPSQTVYEVEKRLHNYTLVRLQLLTGRTHQIRVHMAHLGYPLAGDTLYGGAKVEGIDGQALHCYKLHFRHPWTKKRMTFLSAPSDTWHAFGQA